MRWIAIPVICILLLCQVCQAQQASAIQVFFSPHGGCTEAVVKELDKARSTVKVQAYSFTSRDIAKALVDAHKRGVNVQVVLDKSVVKDGYTEADFILHAGIPVKVDSLHAIAHNKIMVIDSGVVITGSFNFTKQAENSNAENLLVIKDKALAEKYTANRQTHADHSRVYEAKDKGYSETHRSERPVDPAPAAIAGGYVASRNSAVFHKADCKGAAKISEKNMVHYATRDEAIKAGKNPAQECNPYGTRLWGQINGRLQSVPYQPGPPDGREMLEMNNWSTGSSVSLYNMFCPNFRHESFDIRDGSLQNAK